MSHACMASSFRPSTTTVAEPIIHLGDRQRRRKVKSRCRTHKTCPSLIIRTRSSNKMSLLAIVSLQTEVKQDTVPGRPTSHTSPIRNWFTKPRSREAPHSGADAKLHPQRRFVPQHIRLMLRPGPTLLTQLHVKMPHHSCQDRPHLNIRKAKLAKILSTSSAITAGVSQNLLFANAIARSYRKRLERIFAIVTVTFRRLW